MSIIAVLKKESHKVELLKINSRRKEFGSARNDEEIFNFLEKFSPDLILYSTTTGMHKLYLNINKKLKERFNFISVFGGMHVSFFPDFINEESVDIICIGEGEEAISELVNNLESGEEIINIRNLWIKKGHQLYKNNLRPLMEDLDSLPFPDREIVYRYGLHKRNPIKNFITTRGCPYKCSYCFNDGFYKLYNLNGNRRVRSRGVNNIISEINEVKNKYKLKLVYFQDDIITLNENFKELMEEYRREINIPFHAHIRPDLVNDYTIKLLKKGGCLSVTMSAETANDNTRNNMINRNMSKQSIYLAAKLLHKYDIKFRIENMLGLPNETLKDAFDTLEMNIKCKPTIGWASIFQPYPGTELFNYTRDNNLFNGEVDTFNNSFFDNSVLDIKNKKEVENLQKLFSITVSFPFLKPITKQLIKLPKNNLFNFVHDGWKSYCFDNKLYKVNGFKS